MPEPTDRDIEAIAKWLHKRLTYTFWARSSEGARQCYRDAARALLIDPPPVLRRRLKETARG